MDGQPHVVEFRTYTLQPGRRDDLIGLFEREFVEPQEAAGMTLHGQFRVDGAPDEFFWIRGFATMRRRAEALAHFYGGPIWREHRDAANATMIDSDNVLLLRPFQTAAIAPADGESAAFVSGVCFFRDARECEFGEAFRRMYGGTIESSGGAIVAEFVSERGLNTYPRLPVRENVNVFAWLARYPEVAGLRERVAQVCDAIAPACERVEMKILEPTPGSRLR